MAREVLRVHEERARSRESGDELAIWRRYDPRERSGGKQLIGDFRLGDEKDGARRRRNERLGLRAPRRRGRRQHGEGRRRAAEHRLRELEHPPFLPAEEGDDAVRLRDGQEAAGPQRAVEQPLLLALGAQRERGEPLTLHAPHHHTRGFKHRHELQLRRPANREHSAILPVPRAERCTRRVEDEQSRPGRHTTVSQQCDRPAMCSARRHVLGERGLQRPTHLVHHLIGIVALVLAVLQAAHHNRCSLGNRRVRLVC